MAFNYLATVTLEHSSGLPRDRVINTFSFETDSVLLGADADTIRDRLDDFYNATGEGASTSISSHIGNVMSRTIKPVVRFYNLGGHLDGSPAGSPTFIRTFNNNLDTATAAQGLPAEVAVCLSFHSDFGSDVEFAPGSRPRARDRGRVFIGPLHTGVLDTTTGNRVVPNPGTMDSLLGAGKDLRDANDTKRWSVWSRASASMHPVTSCSVDNAFDSQRRRGERPDFKQTL